MNKVFSKIAGLSVGLALAIGVGVAVGGRSAKVAKATEALADSCNLAAKTANCTGYSKEHSYGNYKIYGGQNNNGGWEYFKFGAKKSNKDDPDKITEGYIKGTTALTQNITKVEVVVVANTVSSDVTWDVEVASDADFTDIIDTTSTVTLDRSKSGTAIAEPTSGTSWAADSYYRVNLHITNHSTSNGCLTLTAVNFYYESSTPRGEIEINELSSPIVNVEASGSLSYSWTPASGSSATIESYSWVSSNSEVLSISGNTYTGVAPGVVTVTLNATDSNNEEYSVQSGKIYVTNEYEFAIGDNVALYSEAASMELSGISDTSTKYGIGTAYSGSPIGAYALTVEEGSKTGSFAFKNGDNYLSWTSGNSLATNASKSNNTSWFVISYDDHMIISNVAMATREIWWNSGTPRFACYEGKTTESSGYNSVSLAVIEDAPVRGTIAITAPTDTLLRQGASASATFSWTAPEEAPSTTIASHTWTSSDTAVFSVSGDTYTAVGPGKAKLTLNATDSNGQEYTASTKDITVVSVVSGSYEKVYSVSVGDTVAIVCEADGTQLSGVANKIGSYVFYEDAPDSVFDFVLEERLLNNNLIIKIPKLTSIIINYAGTDEPISVGDKVIGNIEKYENNIDDINSTILSTAIQANFGKLTPSITSLENSHGNSIYDSQRDK